LQYLGCEFSGRCFAHASRECNKSSGPPAPHASGEIFESLVRICDFDENAAGYS
jgi:hypothetical protein